MSLDLFSSSNLAESLMETKNDPFFYTNHPQLPSSDLGNLNLNPQNDSHEPEQVFINTRITTILAKEAMFQKTLTQSDVGKLNRLVLPKQHAEKYFPLLPRDGGASRQQKGLSLTFEDECGKLWHFRYLYWKSSKSYVLTKGWKFYVHEKRLEAGDILFFERYNCERTFIGWKRRSAAAAPINEIIVREVAQPIDGGARINRWSNMFHHAHSGYPSHHSAVSIPLHADNGEAAGEYENVVNNQTGVGATRQLRLFGVDLECPNNSETNAGHPDYQHRLLFQQSSSRHG